MVMPPSKPCARNRCSIRAALTVESCSSSSAMVGLKGSSLLVRSRWTGGGAGVIRVLGDGAASQMELSGDLPYRLFLDPVQAVNVVDLFRREHPQILIYTGRAPPGPGGCSLQDSRREEATLWKTRTSEKATLFFTRSAVSAPTSQTSALERFRSRATLFFTRLLMWRCRSR
jgi:hypothetical protein